MHGSESAVSTIINLIVIFVIMRFVAKAAKKYKQNKPGSQNQPNGFPESKPDNGRIMTVGSDEKTQDMRAGNLQIPRKSIQPRKVRFETKPRFDDNIQLKRCPNCGGEIPVMMMKCDICGYRQTGCGVVFWILLLIVFFFVLIMALDFMGNPVWPFLQKLFEHI